MQSKVDVLSAPPATAAEAAVQMEHTVKFQEISQDRSGKWNQSPVLIYERSPRCNSTLDVYKSIAICSLYKCNVLMCPVGLNNNHPYHMSCVRVTGCQKSGVGIVVCSTACTRCHNNSWFLPLRL